MKQRNRDEHAVGAREFEEELRVQAVEERFSVWEQGAFRDAGGARRVHQDHRVLGGDFRDRGLRHRARERGFVRVGVAAHRECEGACLPTLGARARSAIRERGLVQERLRAAVRE